MSEPTQEELETSIQELTRYEERLKKEVQKISEKLRLPTNKVNSVLKSHSELQKIEKIIAELKVQRNSKL